MGVKGLRAFLESFLRRPGSQRSRNSLMSIFVSTLIIAVLLVPTSMPTAISVSIEGLEGKSVEQGETLEFYIYVAIETDERLPLIKVNLTIVEFPSGKTIWSQLFPIGGGPSDYVNLATPVSIIDGTSYGYTHQYGYGSFYGYGYISGYGYGYYQDGYGYGFYGSQKLRWNATLNTALLPPRDYTIGVEVQSDGVWWGGEPTETTFTITAPPPVKTVLIDIKPGSYPNSINPESKGRIPVGILTDESFDATTVDPATVRFGPDDAKAVHSAIEDVDHDGTLDMILHFKTQETGIKPGHTEATLTGKTYGGISIEGTDTIRTVPPEWAAKHRKGEDERQEHQIGEGQKGEDQRGEDEKGQDRGGKDQKGQQNKNDNEPPRGPKGNPGKGKNNPH